MASLWLLPLAGGAPVKVADIALRASSPDPPLWFGFYGYVAWDAYFAWWQAG